MIYTARPTGFVPEFDVASLYLENNGEILLLHRLPHKSQGDRWGVPAGKVNAGEDLGSALLREVFEETDVHIDMNDVRFFTSVYTKHPEHSFVYHMYHLKSSTRPVITLSPTEHQAYRWVSPTNALAMNLVDDLDTCIEMFYFSQG
jgi:8-oxo-dGTP diphosphatase